MPLGKNDLNYSMNFKTVFHYISYLQYPLMLAVMYFMFKPYISGIDQLKGNPEMIYKSLNSALIFMGLAISFSSLQDTTKTQNKLSRKIWESPLKGKIMILVMCSMIGLFLILGLNGYYNSSSGMLKELCIGMLILGLGMFGLLKSMIEMFENHRKDKN